jgi:hypothetical protein
MLMMCVYDQHGNRMFAEADIGRLATVPARIADPIIAIAKRLSAMGRAEIDELIKNSQTARELKSEGSDSDSPATSEKVSNGSEKTSAPAS